jgi:hypothetical protein
VCTGKQPIELGLAAQAHEQDDDHRRLDCDDAELRDGGKNAGDSTGRSASWRRSTAKARARQRRKSGSPTRLSGPCAARGTRHRACCSL